MLIAWMSKVLFWLSVYLTKNFSLGKYRNMKVKKYPTTHRQLQTENLV